MSRIRFTPLPRLRPARHLAGLALIALTQTATAQVVNGSFETGTLTGWTAGGTAAVAVVQPSHFTGGTPTVADGAWFALLSTGPANRGGAAQRYDANATDDFDQATLSQTFTVPFAPAVVSFEWSFPSSEQNQTDSYDDLFDLRIGLNAATPVQAFSGSSCKNNGSSFSNFPNAPCTGLAQANWTLNATSPAAVQNTTLAFGVGGWRHACVPITGLVAGHSVTLRFSVLDQGDATIDSALLLDQVQVRASCDATPTESLRQLTATSGVAVEIKGGGATVRPVDNYPIAADASGLRLAFVSSANLTGDSPNAIEQVFAWNGAAYARATGLAMTSNGDIQNVAMSSANSGRYVAIAARTGAPGASAMHIYRWDRTTNTVETVTPATLAAGCLNENPTISDDGTRIAWESTCAALTGAGTVRKVLVSTRGASAWPAAPTAPLGTSACIGQRPQLQRNGAAGQFLVLESTCNPLGGTNNSDANAEIFRLDLTATGTAAWRQITATTATRTCTGGSGSNAVFNFAPQISASGQYTLFVSNANPANANALCDSWQVFSYDATAASVSQLTTAATSPRYVGLSLHTDGDHYAYERLNLTTGFSEIGRRQRSVAATDAPVFQGVLGASGVTLGLDGTVPVVNFWTADDPLGSNADGNTEIFSARGP